MAVAGWSHDLCSSVLKTWLQSRMHRWPRLGSRAEQEGEGLRAGGEGCTQEERRGKGASTPLFPRLSEKQDEDDFVDNMSASGL